MVPDPPKSDILPLLFQPRIRPVKVLILAASIHEQEVVMVPTSTSSHHYPDGPEISIWMSEDDPRLKDTMSFGSPRSPKQTLIVAAPGPSRRRKPRRAPKRPTAEPSKARRTGTGSRSKVAARPQNPSIWRAQEACPASPAPHWVAARVGSIAIPASEVPATRRRDQGTRLPKRSFHWKKNRGSFKIFSSNTLV